MQYNTIHTSYAMLSSGIPWNMPRDNCIFRPYTHEPLGETYIEFGLFCFCLHQSMVDTNSASRFGSARIELRKELLSKKC